MKETVISDDASEIRYRDGIRQVKHSAEIERAEPLKKMEVKEGEFTSLQEEQAVWA
ncbi:hypothetical protein ACSE3M_19240 [Bacillus velezensis]